jgi:nitrite reductase (NO-forming)
MPSLYLRHALAGLAIAGILTSPTFGAGSHAHPVENGTAEAPLDIVRAATDLPGPIGERGPQTIRVGLETVEVTGTLADGATYHYWTFNRKVPGPFVRARVGDTVEIDLQNMADSAEPHNVDFHAATGPGGGGEATHAAPGEARSFSFLAMKPGLYVYHCATPLAAEHIANGMYGLILVEPEMGLPPVDQEFYVMQGEIYTAEPRTFAGRAARILCVQRLRRGADGRLRAEGKGRGDDKDLFRRRGPQQGIQLPRHRGDFRHGLCSGGAFNGSHVGCFDNLGAARRCGRSRSHPRSAW